MNIPILVHSHGPLAKHHHRMPHAPSPTLSIPPRGQGLLSIHPSVFLIVTLWFIYLGQFFSSYSQTFFCLFTPLSEHMLFVMTYGTTCMFSRLR